MYSRKWIQLLLLIPLLLSTISLTPVQASMPQASDPTLVMWCPASVVLPRAGKDGCSPASATLVALLDYLSTNEPSQAGKVWLGKSYNSSIAQNIVFDGAALGKMAKYPLTFQGSWNGPGTSTVDLTVNSTLNGDALNVVNWQKKVTLRNITVQNVQQGIDGCFAAVCVGTAGGIQLDHVRALSSGPYTYGALLNNTPSVTSPPGAVIVTNSDFSSNTFTGLWLMTKGAVTIKKTGANNNSQGSGIFIQNTFDATPSAVTVSNSIVDGKAAQTFNQNFYDGLYIEANGPVTLTNVDAENNKTNGANLDNSWGSGDVILKGTSTFLSNGTLSTNQGDGLFVRSKGNITARYLYAYKNVALGAELINKDAGSAKNVTISGGGGFKGNDKGLVVNSKGSVSLNRVQSVSNTHIGIDLFADGNVTLICSSVYGTNTAPGSGLHVSTLNNGPVPSVTLQGFLSYNNLTNNTPNEDILANKVVRTACP